MTVVIFDKFYESNVGGAQISLRRIVESLEIPYEIVCCNAAESFGASRLKREEPGVRRLDYLELPRLPYVEYALNRKAIQRHFATYTKEDVLITQEFWGAMAAAAFPGRTVMFVRNELSTNEIRNYHRGIARAGKSLYMMLNSPFLRMFRRDNLRTLRNATVVIANSKFIADLIRKNTGVEAAVIYPSVTPADFKRVPPLELANRPFITLIGDDYRKGKPIFEAIARAMPGRKFKIIGRAVTEIEERGNITYAPWSRNHSEIFDGTRIVLAPSIWREGFGRVALEAISSGVPVIASGDGGLVEILPPRFLIDDIWNIEAWTAKIAEVEANLTAVGEEVFAHAEPLVAVDQHARLNALLKERGLFSAC